MKHLYLIFISLFLINSQNNNDNFSIDEGKLIWQKVYETELNQDELLNEIKASGNFQEIESFGDKISANITRRELKFVEVGESNSTIPIYIASNDITGFILFEFKDNKYRVTIKNIKLVKQYKDALSDEGELTNIEDFALKNKDAELKKSFLKKPSKVIDFTFSKLTKIEKSSKDNDW
ncbi:hypothetical protein [Christiangramia echinicola]|uniref:hypothetical protein n=1 Tax=Christiangramia echinicola TaxID=279359 RepID=UPI0004264550|nr:hypothetical protein [Christiangramia echinicola]